MKNKNLLFNFGSIAFAILCLGLSFTSATSFKLNIHKIDESNGGISNNMTPIHFADNGNDFGGFMYIPYEETPEEDTGLYYIVNGNKAYECKNPIRGFYYNSQRGERLWPLDEETWKNLQPDLTTRGGIYSECREAEYSKLKCEDCEGHIYKEEVDGNGITSWNCDCKEEDKDPVTNLCKTLESECPEGEECPEVVYADACVKDLDEKYPRRHNYYGQVEHVYKGQTFGLVVGADYDMSNSYSTNWFPILIDSGKVKLAHTFYRAFNKVLIGLVYDYNGGLGLAGCEVNMDGGNPKGTLRIFKKVVEGGDNLISEVFDYSDKDGINPKEIPSESEYRAYNLKGKVECKNIGMAADSLIKVVVEGIVGMSRESNLDVIGNESDTKTQFFSSSDINNSTLINYVKQGSENLCRGKWKQFSFIADVTREADVESKFAGNVICVDLQGNTLSATGSLAIKDSGKTLVVKNGNVEVKPFVDASDSSYYDMFINGGNLIIDETSAPKFVFTRQGFISSKSITEFMTEVGAAKGLYTGELAGVGSFIRGNFIVDGNVEGKTTGKLNNKYFVYGKFTTRESFDDLKNTFVWKCNNGYVKDKNGTILTDQGKFCPLSVLNKDLPGRDPQNDDGGYAWINPYQKASLVVIDQNYDSPLYW